MKYVVTAGRGHIDIDVLACALTYRDALRVQGLDSLVALQGHYNSTVPPSIQQWPIEFETELPEDGEFRFVVVDVSDYRFFADFVKLEDVCEVIDHHHGFEEYWSSRLGEHATVEPVGACATLVWEALDSRLRSEVTALNANLLLAAIISNTLNLQANVTTDRDRQALEEVSKLADSPPGWIESYYREISEEVEGDFVDAVRRDRKRVTIHGEDFVIGQIELWDAAGLLQREELLAEIRTGLGVTSGSAERWILSVPSIRHGHNYLFSSEEWIQGAFRKLFNAEFNGSGVGKTPGLLMRKELLKEIRKPDWC